MIAITQENNNNDRRKQQQKYKINNKTGQQ